MAPQKSTFHGGAREQTSAKDNDIWIPGTKIYIKMLFSQRRKLFCFCLWELWNLIYRQKAQMHIQEIITKRTPSIKKWNWASPEAPPLFAVQTTSLPALAGIPILASVALTSLPLLSFLGSRWLLFSEQYHLLTSASHMGLALCVCGALSSSQNCTGLLTHVSSLNE